MAQAVQVATAVPAPAAVGTNQAPVAIHVQRFQSATPLCGGSPPSSVQVSPGTTARSLPGLASSPSQVACLAAPSTLLRCQSPRLLVGRSVLLGRVPTFAVPSQAPLSGRKTLPPPFSARLVVIPQAQLPPTARAVCSFVPAPPSFSVAARAAPWATTAAAATPQPPAPRATMEEELASLPCVPQFQPPAFMSPLPIPESPEETPLFTFVGRHREDRRFSSWPIAADATVAPPCGADDQSDENILGGKFTDGDIATTGTNDSGPIGTPYSAWTCSDSSSGIGCPSDVGDDNELLRTLEALNQSLPVANRALTHSKSEQAMAVMAPNPQALPRPELGRPPLMVGDSELFASILVSPLGSPAVQGPGSLAFSPSLDLCSFEWTPAPGGASLDVAGADQGVLWPVAE